MDFRGLIAPPAVPEGRAIWGKMHNRFLSRVALGGFAKGDVGKEGSEPEGGGMKKRLLDLAKRPAFNRSAQSQGAGLGFRPMI
jgi:hypothetical protein